jgi:hypothetical protein
MEVNLLDLNDWYLDSPRPMNGPARTSKTLMLMNGEQAVKPGGERVQAQQRRSLWNPGVLGYYLPSEFALKSFSQLR